MQPADNVADIDTRTRALFQMTSTWRKHAKELYYHCQTQMTEWPCLSLDWMPDRKQMMPGCDYTLQYLAISTQALPGTLNSIQVLEFAIPLELEDVENFYGGAGNLGKELHHRYNSIKGHVRVDQLLYVESQVLKMRAMPQDSEVLAIKMSNNVTAIIDTSTKARNDTDGGSMKPDLVLSGHTRPGFALGWNPNKVGQLASGSDDQQLILWDLESSLQDPEALNDSERNVAPTLTLTGHDDVINDLSWHSTHNNVLVTAGGDSDLIVWDTRESKLITRIENAHPGAATCVDFHPFASYLIASGGGDHVGKIWDMRRLEKPAHHLIYHSNEIACVQWAPFSETVLATAGHDRRVVMWDTQKIGMLSTHDDDDYAPPELTFVHSGHLSRIADMRWCPGLEDEWSCASTDMTNVLQLYRPRRDLVYDYVAPDIFDLEIGEDEHKARVKSHQETEKKLKEAAAADLARQRAERAAAMDREYGVSADLDGAPEAAAGPPGAMP